jgi:surface antigen
MKFARPATFILCLAAIFSASACTNPQYSTPEEAIKNACSSLGPRATSGALVGGAAGALGGGLIGAAAGGNTQATAIGAGIGLLVGVAAGVAAGHHLDQQDCQRAQIALQQMQTLPTGQMVAWYGTNGSHGTITAASEQYEAGGHICRRIRSDIYLQGHEPVQGDAGITCRDANGDWARVSE